MKISMQVYAIAAGFLLGATGIAMAQKTIVDINRISDRGIGKKIGDASVSESENGLSFRVRVTGIPKGEHGFHVHEKGSCGPATKGGKATAGMAAGDHFDPEGTKSHKGPGGGGHKGDLPLLRATEKGIDETVVASHLKFSDIRGRSLMIHEGADTYSDTPESGGGKGRIACGVVPAK